MEYIRQTWVDGVTPLDAEHLNHMENGIKANAEAIGRISGESAGTGAGEAVPQYVLDEADSVMNRIAAAQGSRTFTLAAITDLHYGNAGYADGVKHACQALKRIDERIRLDAVAVLGDITDGFAGREGQYAEGVADFRAVNAVLNGLRFAPNMRLHGNHDYCEGRMPEVFRYIGAYSEDAVWGGGEYFYRDFGRCRLRIICLDTVGDDVGNVGYTDGQAQWFAEALDLSEKGNAADWQVLVLSHHPVDFGHVSGQQQRFAAIIDAYIRGAAYTSGGVSCDFAGKNGAAFVGNIHGHIHNLLVDRIYKGGVQAGSQMEALRIATPEACFGRANGYDGVWHEGTTYAKTENTKDDTSFVVYCIDLDTSTIRAVCYGAGYDRTITYGDSLSWDGMPDDEGGGNSGDDGGEGTGGYTNQIPIAVDEAGNTVTDGIMYADKRYNSSGNLTEAIGYNITGLIPAAVGDFIRVRWKNDHEDEKYGDMGYQGFRAFNAAREPIAVRQSFQYMTDASNAIGALFTAADGFYYERENGIIDFELVESQNVPADTAYIAFTLCGDMSAAIITVNEPIE